MCLCVYVCVCMYRCIPSNVLFSVVWGSQGTSPQNPGQRNRRRVGRHNWYPAWESLSPTSISANTRWFTPLNFSATLGYQSFALLHPPPPQGDTQLHHILLRVQDYLLECGAHHYHDHCIFALPGGVAGSHLDSPG